MTWRNFVLGVIEGAYRPGQSFTLQNLYQRLQASPDLAKMNEVEAFEATVRGTMNKLVDDGSVLRLQRGTFRRLDEPTYGSLHPTEGGVVPSTRR